jgi:hypothetical protein
VLVGVAAYGFESRIHSLALLADAWGLPHPETAPAAEAGAPAG